MDPMGYDINLLSVRPSHISHIFKIYVAKTMAQFSQPTHGIPMGSHDPIIGELKNKDDFGGMIPGLVNCHRTMENHLIFHGKTLSTNGPYVQVRKLLVGKLFLHMVHVQ